LTETLVATQPIPNFSNAAYFDLDLLGFCRGQAGFEKYLRYFEIPSGGMREMPEEKPMRC